MNIQDFEHQLRDEITRRAKMLVDLEKDKAKQKATIQLCEENIFTFINNFVWFDKNKALVTDQELPEIIPAILFPYQVEFITDLWECIVMGTLPVTQRNEATSIFIEKSRQMGATWLVAIVFVYWFLFHDHRYLCLSQKEDDVDSDDLRSIFRKIRLIIEKLPQWMLPDNFLKEKGTLYNKHLLITKKGKTSSISGDSTRSVRWGNYNCCFLDEMAYMDNAKEVDTAVAAATPCMIYNSTPNGEFNEYYEKRKLAMKWDIRFHRLHWKENPLYTEEWYIWACRGKSPEFIAREYEIQYVTSMEWRVYPEFNKQNIIDNEDFDMTRPTFISIDNSHGGKDPHAVVVAQLDGNLIRIIDNIQINTSVDWMADFMAWMNKIELNNSQLEFYTRLRTLYLGATYIGDPYDTNSTVNDATIAQKYMQRGIYLNTFSAKNFSKVSQIQLTRWALPKIRVHNRCTDFMAAISNARYPTRSDNSQSTSEITLPIHDQTSHYRTSMEYLVTYLEERKPLQVDDFIPDRVPVRNYLTWEISYS